MSQKILVAQGGGPTAVINQSLVGVALEARKFAGVERVYGAAYGVRGIVNEDFVDLSRETSRNLEAVANTPPRLRWARPATSRIGLLPGDSQSPQSPWHRQFLLYRRQ